MSETDQLKYLAEHEWVLIENDTVTLGITDYFARNLDSVIDIKLPAVGSACRAEYVCAEVVTETETVDVFSPLTGEVVAVNHVVNANPGLLVSDPFGEGWLLKIRINPDDLAHADFLDRDVYLALTGHVS